MILTLFSEIQARRRKPNRRRHSAASKSFPIPVEVREIPRQSFRCPICHLDFKKEKEFNTHVDSLHSFKCEFCPLQFNYANGLSDHVNKEHQEEVIRGVGSRSQSLCRCQKLFKRESTLSAHRSMPHDYPCPECELEFTGEVFLKDHLLKSHQIKPSSVKKSRRSSSEKSQKSKKKDLSSKESVLNVRKSSKGRRTLRNEHTQYSFLLY